MECVSSVFDPEPTLSNKVHVQYTLTDEMVFPVIEKTAPRLFISYSHDSREHEDWVRAFADRLRRDGVDAIIDQYDTAPPDQWPMWADREIQKADFIALVCTQTYLRRVEGRELPEKGRGVLWEARLIYNLFYGEDTTFQRFIPILLQGGTPSLVPLPIRGLTHYKVDSEVGYEDFYRHITSQPRHQKSTLGKLKSLPAISPQSYPASLEIRADHKTVTSLDQRNRLQMLKRVRLDWIDGVLKQSLYQVARIELGLQKKSDAVEQPLRAIVQTPDRPPTAVPPGTAISQVFDDHGAALLILGAPGTGKTTLLVELAEQLLNRAEQNESHPIPVVFNLSSWAVQRPPLSQWLVSELNERSDVPKRVAQRWLETEQILPLLDGLDEVAVDHRQACAEAINDFRRDHGLVPIAVCSRIADYEALSAKLRLRIAVVVQALTRPEVQNYLERIGDPSVGLRAHLEGDSSFWELLQTPLMLWVAVLAYRDIRVQFSTTDTVEQRRKRLFASFVDAMFERRSTGAHYTREQTVRWLCWLGAALKHNEQTVLFLEYLNENFLATRLQKLLSKAGAIVSSSLTGWLVGLAGEQLLGASSSANLGMVVGGTVALYRSDSDLRPVETTRVSPTFLLRSVVNLLRSPGKWLRPALYFMLGVPIIVGVVLMIVDMLSSLFHRLLLIIPHAQQITGMISRAISGLISRVRLLLPDGMMSWVFAVLGLSIIIMLVSGLIMLVFGEVKTRKRANEGIGRSIKMALATGLALGLSGWLLGGVDFGLIVGLTSGLAGGGLFSLRHVVLRLMLWVNRSTPLRYVRFLDYAVEHLFLRKVGGGYIFVHRMLMEYFASLPEQSVGQATLPGDGS